MTTRRSLSSRAASLLVAGAFLLLPHARVSAQEASSGPEHAGYDPSAPVGAHDHSGPHGEALLDIEHALRCNCSCTLDTHSCQFQMQCGVSPGWTERIRRSLEAGETPEAIQASFVADYGTQVLIAPPAEGFNLLGYFFPGAAILIAGALIAVGVRSNMKHVEAVPIPEVDPQDAERLRAEWQKLDESESPDW